MRAAYSGVDLYQLFLSLARPVGPARAPRTGWNSALRRLRILDLFASYKVRYHLQPYSALDGAADHVNVFVSVVPAGRRDGVCRVVIASYDFYEDDPLRSYSEAVALAVVAKGAVEHSLNGAVVAMLFVFLDHEAQTHRGVRGHYKDRGAIKASEHISEWMRHHSVKACSVYDVDLPVGHADPSPGLSSRSCIIQCLSVHESCEARILRQQGGMEMVHALGDVSTSLLDRHYDRSARVWKETSVNEN